MEKYRYIRKTVTWNHHRYEVRGKTEQEACDKLADLITTLKQGDLALAGSNLTVDQWFAQWRDTYKAPSGLTPKSFGLYDEKYRGYIGPAVGHLKLTEVRDLHLQTILNTQAGRSYSHVSKLRMVMQELFRQARRSRILLYDPAEGLQLPESVKGTHRPITNQERRHILALAQTHPSGLWVLTILYTGLRPGETAALLWKDIDFARNEIHVYKAVESGTRAIKAPKTPAGVSGISPCARSCETASWRPVGRRRARSFPRPGAGCAAPIACGGCGTPLPGTWTCAWGPKSGTEKWSSTPLPRTSPPTACGTPSARTCSGQGCPSTWPRSSWATPTSP